MPFLSILFANYARDCECGYAFVDGVQNPFVLLYYLLQPFFPMTWTFLFTRSASSITKSYGCLPAIVFNTIDK